MYVDGLGTTFSTITSSDPVPILSPGPTLPPSPLPITPILPPSLPSNPALDLCVFSDILSGACTVGEWIQDNPLYAIGGGFLFLLVLGKFARR